MNRRVILTAAFINFVAIGVLAGVMGPALPDLADRVGTDLATIGVLVTTSFLGTLTGQAIAGPLNDRLGQRPVLLAGIGLTAGGAAVLVLGPSLGIMIGGSAVFGIGFGALDVSSNLLVARHFADQSVSVLNLLHTFYGVGSVIGPALASLSLRVADTAIPVFWVGVAILLLPIPFVLRVPQGIPATSSAQAVQAAGGNGAIYRAPVLWLLGVILLLYVGVEAGLGSWITAYTDRTTDLGKEGGALLTSAYWLALTIGRILGALYGGRFSPYGMLRLTLIGMLAGAVIFVLGTGSGLLTAIAVLVLGLFSGPPYPTVVAITTMLFPHGPGKATGVVVSLGSMGAATLPWTMGALLDRVSPEAAAWFILAQSALLVGIYALLRRADRAHRAARLPAPGTVSADR